MNGTRLYSISEIKNMSIDKLNKNLCDYLYKAPMSVQEIIFTWIPNNIVINEKYLNRIELLEKFIEQLKVLQSTKKNQEKGIKRKESTKKNREKRIKKFVNNI